MTRKNHMITSVCLQPEDYKLLKSIIAVYLIVYYEIDLKNVKDFWWWSILSQ